MSGSPIFLFELLIFSGAALAWAGWELWSVRRTNDAKATPDAEPVSDPSSGEAGHPKG